jgi:dihydrofolate reductase
VSRQAYDSQEVDVRKLIAGMKTSVDGKIEGAEGYADWVDAWSEDYGLTSRVDACVLGGRMYPDYERFWTRIQSEPGEVHPMSGRVPTPAEVEWARFAARTPHYVLSSTLTSALWPQTGFVRGVDEIAALKQQSGKDIYLMGGAQITASLIDAGLVDEFRLIAYPLIAGDGKSLFSMTERRPLELRNVQQLSGGRLSLVYGIG